MQPDFTACAGCGRNSHGDPFCSRCEELIERQEKELDRKKREKDQEDEDET